MASTEQLLASSTLERGVRNGVDGTGALPMCGCGKTCNNERECMMHTLRCPGDAPIGPPGAGEHAHGATLPRNGTSSGQ